MGWDDGRVCLAAMLIPKSLVPDYGETFNPEDRPLVVGDSFQMDRCIPAEVEYGNTILEINPDKPENFVKLKAKTSAK